MGFTGGRSVLLVLRGGTDSDLDILNRGSTKARTEVLLDMVLVTLKKSDNKILIIGNVVFTINLATQCWYNLTEVG